MKRILLKLSGEALAGDKKTGFDEDTVRKVIKLVDINEYKRRQAPVGPRITSRNFGKDRRYPITCGFGRNNW